MLAQQDACKHQTRYGELRAYFMGGSYILDIHLFLVYPFHPDWEQGDQQEAEVEAEADLYCSSMLNLSTVMICVVSSRQKWTAQLLQSLN